MSLIFSYEELFGVTALEEPVNLSESEIDNLKKRYTEQTIQDKTFTTQEETRSVAKGKNPQKGGKKDKDKDKGGSAKENTGLKLTEAQRKLQKEAINSLNTEILGQSAEEKKREAWCCQNEEETKPDTEIWGRIFGSHFSDFIELQQATPWKNYTDFQHCFIMFAILIHSVIKIGLLA